MNDNILTPPEIADYTAEAAVGKAKGSFAQLLVLGFLAGVFIAFASEGSNMAAFNLLARPETYGLGKVLAGAVFGTGLMLVVLAGGELFTGNTLMIVGVLRKRITIRSMLRNWSIVYIGNFLGSIFIAYLMTQSGLFQSGAGMLGAVTLQIAVAKVSLTWVQALILGILCNWLVCLAIYMAYGAKTMAGKILAIFFPIWLFITSGFEHSIANMYYIPAGLFIKTNSLYAEMSGLTEGALQGLTWVSFLLHNLVPVTIGNIIGGSVFVGMAYWYAYQRNK